MTYALKLTPSAAALLDGYCRSAGQSLKTALGHHLTRHAALPEPQPIPAAPAAAVVVEPVIPAAAPMPMPAPMPEPRPATPEEEDAMFALLGGHDH